VREWKSMNLRELHESWVILEHGAGLEGQRRWGELFFWVTWGQTREWYLRLVEMVERSEVWLVPRLKHEETLRGWHEKSRKK
jgi:hypothetical protein